MPDRLRRLSVDADAGPPHVLATRLLSHASPAHRMAANRSVVSSAGSTPYGQKIGRHDLTRPLDGNSAEVRPVARDTALALRAAKPSPEGTAGRCPVPGGSARHGNGRHTRSAPVAATARRTGSPWTGTPP